MTAKVPSNRVLLACAALAILLGVVLAVGPLRLLMLGLKDYPLVQETVPPVFEWSTATGALFVAPVAGLFFLLLAFMMLWRVCTGRPAPPKLRRLVNGALAVIAIGGVIGLIVVRFSANSYWEMEFREAGYARCPNSFFLTSRWFTKVWVQDLDYCHDPEVRTMMASPRHGIDDINEYLRGQDRVRGGSAAEEG